MEDYVYGRPAMYITVCGGFSISLYQIPFNGFFLKWHQLHQSVTMLSGKIKKHAITRIN